MSNSPSERRVAVLGATGWLGRHICASYARDGYGVLAIARHYDECLEPYPFLALDLGATAPELMAGILRAERITVAVHATDASNTNDGWWRTPDELFRYNVRLVEDLLSAIAMLPWSIRFVHLGTIHEHGLVPKGTRIDETTPLRPVNSYTRSKMLGSQAVLEATRAGRVDGAVLRLANVWGPDPSPSSFPGKLALIMREAQVSRRPVPVAVSEDARDWIDVRDAADAVLRAGERLAPLGVFNIGRGEAVETGEFVDAMMRICRLPEGRIDRRAYHPAASLTANQWIQVDASAARALLAWCPRIGLTESLTDMLASLGSPPRDLSDGHAD